MFKFNEVYRKALDDKFPISHRWANGKRCIYKHSQLIGQSYNGTLARFCDICKLNPALIYGLPVSSADSESLVRFLFTLKMERDRFLQKYRICLEHRKIDKKHGRLKRPQFYLYQLHIPDYYDSRCIPLAPWKQGGKYGYINTSGKFEIIPQFDFAEPFAFGKATVKIKNQSLTIDVSGNYITE